MAAAAKAFVRRHTSLRAVPGLASIRLHLTDDVLSLWRATQLATGDADAPLPYWACAWAGGLALASYLGEHPERVAGRRVFDLGSGSGLCAIAASKAGASAVTAVDIDPFAEAAAELNARANGCRIDVLRRDVLDDPPPDETDLVLAADCWYEAGLASRVTPWLRRAHEAGLDVVIGDPGRRYLPPGLIELASYDVRTTTELEDLAQKVARVYALRR
jgi:predicted nicotinamide N-methyase